MRGCAWGLSAWAQTSRGGRAHARAGRPKSDHVMGCAYNLRTLRASLSVTTTVMQEPRVDKPSWTLASAHVCTRLLYSVRVRALYVRSTPRIVRYAQLVVSLRPARATST